MKKLNLDACYGLIIQQMKEVDGIFSIELLFSGNISRL